MKKIIAMLVCACVLLCSCGNSVGQAPNGDNSDSAADQQEPMASTLPSEMDADFPIEEWCDEDGVIDVERLLSDYEWNESYNYQVGINSETDGWYMVQPGNKDEIARGKSTPQITLRCDGDNGSSFSINNVRGLGNLDDLDVEWNARTKLEMMRTKNDDVVPKDLMRLLCVAMNTVKYGTDETSLVESFVDLTDEAELEGIKIGFYKLDFEKMIGVHYSGEEALTAAYQDASTDSGDPTDDSMEAESGEEIPALGHDWGKWTQTTAPTCTEEGAETHECSRCHVTETRTLAKLGHTEKIDAAVPATCTETGLTEGKPLDCCGDIAV